MLLMPRPTPALVFAGPSIREALADRHRAVGLCPIFHIDPWVTGLLGGARQSFRRPKDACRGAQERDMPSTVNTETIVLAIAAFLFAFALVSLVAWALKTFVLSERSGASYLKGLERRLGVVETASVDGQRRLILIRRDNIQHLIMTGGPVDMLIETGIAGHKPVEQPVGDVMIARSDPRAPRAASDYSKT